MTSIDRAATTVMPPAAEIMRRLCAVDDMPHMVDDLYTRILPIAGVNLNGTGVVLALHLAVADYTADMPPFVAAVVLMRLESFTRALLDPGPVLDNALERLGQLDLLTR